MTSAEPLRAAMRDRVVVDTNILVYADDRAAKSNRVRAVLTELIRARRAVVSTHVMQDNFVAAIKRRGLSPERARMRVERLNRLDVVLIRPELILGAIDLSRLHALLFWDALDVRSATAAGCGRLLSEDMPDGQTIDGVRSENPFGVDARIPPSGRRPPCDGLHVP